MSSQRAIHEAPSTHDGDAHSALRRRIVSSQRRALLEMRSNGEIGDDAFHRVEAMLDAADLHAGAAAEQ